MSTFWKDALIRAGLTFLQTAMALVSVEVLADATTEYDFQGLITAGVAGLAAAFSVLSSAIRRYLDSQKGAHEA